MKEVHVQIRLPSDGFPSQEQMDLRDEVEAFIEAKALGEVVDAGSGLGTMDLRIEAPAPKKAVAAIRAYLSELGFADHATCELVRSSQIRPPLIPYQPGDALAVTLPDGEYAAALVLACDRVPRAGITVLVGVLRYRAGVMPPLAVFAERQWLALTHHSCNGRPHLSWYQAHDFAAASSSLQKVGTVALLPSDPKTANSISPWSFLAGQIVAQASWEVEHP
jgi:hypothetical protein